LGIFEIAPNFIPYLPIGGRGQSSPQRNKFEVEIWKRWLCSILLAIAQRISKNS